MDNIRILLVEDHKIVREGTRQLLEQTPGLLIVGEASDGQEAIKMLECVFPDVVVMDVHMPGLNGIEVTKWISLHFPQTRVLILSAFDDDRYVFPVMDAGANGYLLKTAGVTELARGIHMVYSGGTILDPKVADRVVRRFTRRQSNDGELEYENLSDRELEVLTEVARGKSNREVGEALSISSKTVHSHLKNIFSKLQIRSRTEAAVYAIHRGWIKIEPPNE